MALMVFSGELLAADRRIWEPIAAVTGTREIARVPLLEVYLQNVIIDQKT